MRHFSTADFRTGRPERERGPQRNGATPASPPAPHGARRISILTACGVLLVAAIVGATAMLAFNMRAKALRDTERQLANVDLVLAEQIAQSFHALELVQTSVIEHMRAKEIETGEQLDRLMAGYEVHQMLADKISGLPQVDAVTIINAHGRLVNFSRYWPIPAVNVADRDYFKALKADTERTFFLSEPVQNRGTGTWTIYLARKFTGSDGTFLGLVLGAIRLKYFEDYFGAISLGHGGAVALLRRDGMLLARYPNRAQTIGRIYSAIPKGSPEPLVIRRISLIDGQERLLAIHPIRDFPAVVAASTTVAAAAAGAERDALLLSGAGGALAMSVGTLVFLAARRAAAQRARTQRALEGQQRTVDTALNNMSRGLIMFDARGRVVLCNKLYLEMYKLAPDQVVPGCDRVALLEARKAAGTFAGDPTEYCAAMGAPPGLSDTETIVGTPDGRTIRIVRRAMADGGWVATHEDVTERRRTERERDRNRDFLDRVIETVPVMIIVKDARDLRYVLLNRASERRFGYAEGAAIGKTAYDIFPQERANWLNALEREVLRDKQARILPEHEIELPAGGKRVQKTSLLPILGDDGEPLYLLIVAEDLTERRRMEQERDRSREFLDLVIESVPVMIMVKDARDLRYLLLNKEAERQLGFSEGTGIGKSTRDVFPPALVDRFEAEDRAVIREKRAHVTAEHEVKVPGAGRRVHRTTKIPILGKDGQVRYLLIVAEDLTERKAMELQLQQAVKMEAVGNLTGGIAHDFNNLLMVMIGNLDLLAEEAADHPPVHEKVETVLNAALRGAELTRQMLAFARRQPLNPKRILVKDTIASTARLLGRTLGDDVTIEIRVTDDLWPVRVDEAQLESSLVNIAINARDAMPGGGTLIVEASNVAIDADTAAHCGGLSPGDYVVIAMSDSGTGMPPELIARVFEPFVTTKPRGKGTGLGLAMVYGFVKQSGGHVSVYSEVGRGTTLKLYLPRDAGPAESRGVAETQSMPLGGGETVLAVDDNKDVLKTVERQLADLGYNVVTAGSAFSALSVLERGVAADLLFSDVVMPGGMSGTDLADQARRMCPGLKVLLTSGFTDAFLASSATLQSRYALLSKPYRKRDLARAVHEALGHADG